MDKLISELLILPERVRKGDFVLNLSKGVTEPEKTLEQYVVTPQLVACFDDALGFIKSAVDAANSKACYLHGSFGAGKSHFMAVLHLLLAAQPRRAVDPRTGQGLRQARLGREQEVPAGAVPHDRRPQHGVGHPGRLRRSCHAASSRCPAARRLSGRRDLQERQAAPAAALGDEKFFEQLNQGATRAAAGSGWGKLAKGWDAARFEAALEAPPSSDERTRLVGDLVQYIFPAFKGHRPGQGRSLRRSRRGPERSSAPTPSRSATTA